MLTLYQINIESMMFFITTVSVLFYCGAVNLDSYLRYSSFNLSLQILMNRLHLDSLKTAPKETCVPEYLLCFGLQKVFYIFFINAVLDLMHFSI